MAAYPKKTRELHNHHFDSTVWNDFTFRDDDIIIATYAKSGTTWMQQIVAQLIFNGADRPAGRAKCRPGSICACRPSRSSWPAVEAQTHRRFIKTHLPVDALVFSPQGQIPLHRPRWPRRGVEHVQPPRQRQRALVRGAQRHAGPRRAAARAAAGVRSGSISAIGWSATATRSGRSGKISAAGGTSATCPMCMLLHFDDLKRDLPG